MRIILICFLLLGLLFKPALSQEKDSITIQGHYVNIGAGISSGLLRDYGTSPLFYTALMADVSINDQYYFGKNRLFIKFQTNNGAYLRFTDNQNYSATANCIDAEISYFRHVGEIGNTKIQHAPGLSISNYTSIRSNQDFGNGGFSFDNISSLQAKYSFSRILTRAAKDKKFLWLIKYHRKEKHYRANIDFGIPLYSIIYRQGYTNPGNSTLDYTDPFEGYDSYGKFFSGMNTQLALNRILENGNMYGLSYNWSFLSTGKKDSNQLNMSHHAIMFHLIFKFN